MAGRKRPAIVVLVLPQESAVAVLLVVVRFVGPGEHTIHPFLVAQVPAYGLGEPFLKLQGGFPTQFAAQFFGVNGVALIVSRTVLHKGDEAGRITLRPVQLLIHHLAKQVNEVDVLPFVEAANVVGLAHFSLVKNHIDGCGMVLHIQPVANVVALAVNRNGLFVQDVVDGQGQQFFRKLVGSVVVGTVADDYGQSVSVVVGSYQVFRTGLGGRIGTARIVGRAFGKEALGTQSTVHFVGRNVVNQFASEVVLPLLACCIKQGYGTHNVGGDELHGVADAAVDVRLCSQVNDAVEFLGGE